MRRLVGAHLFALTVVHRAHVRDLYILVPCMRVRTQRLQRALQFFTTLYSF
jgi:hypothetical protein